MIISLFPRKKDNRKNIAYDKNGYPFWEDSGLPCHHRSIMKKHNLKDIEEGWEVHHIDGDKNNFHQGNLILLRDQDHKDLEKYTRHLKNLNIAYFFLVSVAFIIYLVSYLKPFGDLWSHVYFLIASLFLFLAFILRIVPQRKLRRALFLFGFLKKSKT